MTLFLFLLCAVAAILLMGGYYTYRIAFYSPKKGRDKISTFASHKYDPYRKEINRLFCQLSDRPYEEVSIVSFDGLTLFGRYYHVKDGAPLDIGFHGYRSSALTDFAGGSELSFSMGHNLLLIDERAHGRSEGRTITFGIQERWDADSWVRYAVERFGADTEIILYQSPNGLVKCAYLTDKDSKNGAWYIIDTTAKSAVPFINVASAYKSFIILTAGEDVTVPSGYTAFTYKFNKNSVTAYHKYEDDTILVVYAMSPDGEPGWFFYDTVEKTFTRFVASAVPTEAVTTASATDANNGSFFDQHKDKVITICIIVIVVMFFLIIILGIMLIRVIKQGLPDDDPDDDPDGDASNNLDNNINDNTSGDAENDTDDNAGNDPDNNTSGNAENVPDNTSNNAADDTPDNTDHNTGNDTGIDTDNTSDDTVSANDTKSEDTIAAAVVLDETPAENADDTNNQKPADIPVTDGMTELTAKPSVKAEDITSTRLSSETKKAKEEKEATPADKIIKKAAQYSSMNTADLSEVFNMAEAIVNHEEPKKNTGSLQFKPIKQNVPGSKEEK